ncbi:MAG TPA: hypothetical protein VGQ58_00410 [Candidatus Limnocylindrales bacterium]|jgi:hypothetical protein|nr:hypothetical protein [Candidatus Limnocylindrales bacterium]
MSGATDRFWRSDRREMRLPTLVLATVCLGLAACASATTPTPSPPPSATPSSTPADAAIELRPAPANIGCDAVPAPYQQVTFRIEAAASVQVTAVADTGAVLRTFWSVGFRGGRAADPVIRDPAGQVVVANGDVLVIPERDWPRLQGYFVCPSNDELYVLLSDPE